MPVTGENIQKSLELVVEKHGDPTDRIYDALFKAHPEFADLFVLDVDGGVRGSMLQHTFECIDDYLGDRNFVGNFVATTRGHHTEYGVPDGSFDIFFTVMRDTFMDIIGDQWTDAMKADWQTMIDDFAEMV